MVTYRSTVIQYPVQLLAVHTASCLRPAFVGRIVVRMDGEVGEYVTVLETIHKASTHESSGLSHKGRTTQLEKKGAVADILCRIPNTTPRPEHFVLMAVHIRGS